MHRHRLSTRIWHWANAGAILLMLMSGLMISNAHPHLYWGEYGANFDRPWWSPPHFPGWATIPSTYSLAAARHWHLFFAWIFAFGLAGHMGISLVNGHIRRDLALGRRELAPARLWRDVKDHARLRFPTGQAALGYNVLQKIAYVAVIFGLLPLLVVTGLSLSPGFDAVLHLPLDLLGGRASARSIHFLCAGAIVGFTALHLALVVLAGPYNEVRSMITGRYRVPPDRDAGPRAGAAGGGGVTAPVTRRALVGAALAGAGGLLTGCDRLGRDPRFQALLRTGEAGNYAIQRLLQDRTALAEEFAPSQRSPVFRANGTRMPAGADYARHLATGFADWRLVVDGAVARPQAFGLDQLRAMPARRQITRHDCVEGWSAIAEWTGVPLKLLLDRAGVSPRARYIVFHCADPQSNGTMYYESIDRIDAAHPQTMLAWAINGRPLPVANGAPLRLRVERQLGYKHAKYVQRVEAVATLAGTYGGRGGYWEDAAGYEWYAGI